jgi:hypothetical protein
MSKTSLTAEELYFLGEYKGIEEIHGISFTHTTKDTEKILINKDLLDKDGRVNKKTVWMVELIRKYQEAPDYFEIDNYIFGIYEDGFCVALQKIK